MHGLVVWTKQKRSQKCDSLNDTRTTEQCRQIYDIVGKEKLLGITKNVALEGFTLPKILWVKQYEPEIFEKIDVILLPKDYLRYRMTGQIHMDYSDAAGTLLLDISKKEWSSELCRLLEIDPAILPPLVESGDFVGNITKEFAEKTGLSVGTKVFAGGADNACGAIGAGILSSGKTLASIGTSGVVLSYEETKDRIFKESPLFQSRKRKRLLHNGRHVGSRLQPELVQGHICERGSFDDFVSGIEEVPRANGLLFAPYIVGSGRLIRTPISEAVLSGIRNIRGPILSGGHGRNHFFLE